MAEFNVAGVYRDVIHEAYPDRRIELSSYLAIWRYVVHEYHKSILAKQPSTSQR